MMHKVSIDADRIAPRLWQGSDPPGGPYLRDLKVDTLVLCARELQHDPREFPGVKVIHAPMDDASIVPVRIAMDAAAAAARAHKRGKRVLVCCAAGLNRSGLVMALTIWMRSGELSGRECVEQVRAHRDAALNNPRFVEYVASLPPRRRVRFA